MSISRQTWHEAVAGAARAPSPHNAQPARWRLSGTRVELHADTARWLAAGDASGRDDLVSLGMAWEAMALTLSDAGLGLSAPHLEELRGPPAAGAAVRLVAAAEVTDGAVPDPLARWQTVRRCYRGSFSPCLAGADAHLDACLAEHTDVAAPIAQHLHKNVARWYDAAVVEGLRNVDVAQELFHWMRFSQEDPRWSRDGLAADCLMLSGIEAWGASWLMRPRVLHLLDKVGLLGLVVAERDKVMSATRLVAIHAAHDESPFHCGRRWYRFWLALTVAGFSAVPMSALVDSSTHTAALLAAQPLPPGRRLINLMRVGPTPREHAPRSARLPVPELMLP